MTRSSLGSDRLFQNPLVRMTSPEERESRLAKLRAMAQEEGFDALLIVGRDDIRFRGRTVYVSDYWQLLSDAMVVLPMQGDTVYIGHPVLGVAQAEAWVDWPGEYRVAGQPGNEAGKVLSDLGAGSGTIGVVGLADAMSHKHYMELTEALPNATIADATTSSMPSAR